MLTNGNELFRMLEWHEGLAKDISTTTPVVAAVNFKKENLSDFHLILLVY